MNNRVTDKEIYPALWVLLVTLGIAYLLWRYWLGQPTISGCWIWRTWGVYCPGCGGTRSLEALCRGRVIMSLYYHPAVPVMAGGVTVYLVSQTIWRLRGRRGAVLRYSPRWSMLLVGLLLANCAIRNLLWLGFGLPI